MKATAPDMNEIAWKLIDASRVKDGDRTKGTAVVVGFERLHESPDGHPCRDRKAKPPLGAQVS